MIMNTKNRQAIYKKVKGLNFNYEGFKEDNNE